MLNMPMLRKGGQQSAAQPETLFLCNNDTDLIGSRAVTIAIPADDHITGWQEGMSERNESYLVVLPSCETPEVLIHFCPAMSASLSGLSVPTLTIEAWIEYEAAYTHIQSYRWSYPMQTIHVDWFSPALQLMIGTTQALAWNCISSESAATGTFWSSVTSAGSNYNSETGEEVTLPDLSGVYHHLAITADGSNISFYCDGARCRQETYAAVGWPAGVMALGTLRCHGLGAYSAVRVSSGVRYAGATYATPAHPLTA